MKRWIIIGLLSVVILFLFGSLAVTAGELRKTQTQIIALEKDIAGVTAGVSAAKSELALLAMELSSVKSENDRLRKGDHYNLRDVPYKEVMDFLAADLTDKNKFIKGEYEAPHFARDVINSAKEKGLRCALAHVARPDGKVFSLVAFQTVDTGLVFVNPQDDKVMKVTKGGRLWRDNGYTVSGDDTIVDILIYW